MHVSHSVVGDHGFINCPGWGVTILKVCDKQGSWVSCRIHPIKSPAPRTVKSDRPLTMQQDVYVRNFGTGPVWIRCTVHYRLRAGYRTDVS